jgi:glycosyltransferase involved in cell wall biosynthesis
MKIGVVSPRWLPDFGGAQIYVDRFGRALTSAGHTMQVATASKGTGTESPIHADRHETALGDDPATWEPWYDWVETWIKTGDFTHVIMNTPLTRGSHHSARRLYNRARASGARVGCFHYDLGRVVTTELAYAHARHNTWAAAARFTLTKARQLIAEHGLAETDALLESPLLFDPDFVISCSAWSDRFIDPLDRCARLVLRPFMAADWQPQQSAIPPTADIGFVNPLPHKGADRLLAVMQAGPPHWTYRVLGGGYGNSLAQISAALMAAAPGRVECIQFVDDVRDFYASVGVIMFASHYEGYGMAAVEPGFVGTPTVATDYPSIIEGVGDAARIVPYAAETTAWIAALQEVLTNRTIWSARALDRARWLLDRQSNELTTAQAFLTGL